MSVTTNRRRIRNLLLDPGKQYRHALVFFGFMAAGALLLQTVLMTTTQRFVVEALTASGVDPIVLATSMKAPLRAYLWRTALLFPFLAILSLFLSLRMTHRFLGPQVALERHIAALRDGDYRATCRLRASDELQRIGTALNELAAALRERHGADEDRRAA